MMIGEVFGDAVIDSGKMLPFLFAAFLFMEWIERYSGDYMNRILKKVGHAGPVVGALCGCIPQCGFSVVAANLFAGGIITPGTLLAVFLATSDEAILIMLGHPGKGKEILSLIVVKIIIAILAGYLIDFLFPKRQNRQANMEQICVQCGCRPHGGGKGSILKGAVYHTIQIFLYILVFTVFLNFAIALAGTEKLSAALLGYSPLQPVLAAFIGMIPNCAASVILTELYLSGAIRFASVTAGLCTGAGLGLIVLFKMNKNIKENIKLAGILYIVAAASGCLLEFIG